MNRLRSSLLILALSAAAACGDDSNDPSPIVPGTYEATRFVLIESGSSPIDALAEGASLFMDITAEGTTDGELFIPAILTEEGLDDEIVSMEGTYTQSGNTIDFQQAGDSFVPLATWVVGSGTITGVWTSADNQRRVEVTLTRQ
jgi:hypothetical protein